MPRAYAVQQSQCALSDNGIVIGVNGPGFVEWKFSRSGPFPSVIQPFFVPAPGQGGRILLRTPSQPVPHILFDKLPLRNRPFDISATLKDENAFALRFEGIQAR